MSKDTDQVGRVIRLTPQRVVKVRHDLRNPLGHVLGFAELLLERAKHQELPEAVEPLRALVEASEQILDEINHCLDPRRLQSGQSDIANLREQVEEFCRGAARLSQQARRTMGEQASEDVERILDSAFRMQELGNELLPLLEAEVAASPQATPALIQDRTNAGRDVIGLSTGSGDERDHLVQELEESGCQVELLDPCTAVTEAVVGLNLDVLIIELDLAKTESIRLLERLKEQTATTRVPVMVLARAPTALAVRQALRAGAQDVLRLPLQQDLLLARVGCQMALKRLHDQERALLRRISSQQAASDQLLSGILPATVLQRIRRGEKCIADHYPEATVISVDFGGLSRWATGFPPEVVATGLSEVFAAYDKLCLQRSLPVGRVLGDSYQVVSGVPEPNVDQVGLAAELALALQREALPLRLAGGRLLRARIGLHCGPVSAGVLGQERFSFEVWGEAVEVAGLLRGQAPSGAILTSSATSVFLQDRYVFEEAPTLRLSESKVLPTKLLLGKVP